MLKLCTAPGCQTIVFGVGTCVDHDRRAAVHELMQMANRRLVAAGPLETTSESQELP
jgi:hypothetical protein